MNRSWRWLMACVVVASAGVGAAQAQSQAACDRTCLRTTLDQYLNAVIAHDPSKAPLLLGMRQTENAISVRPGQGVWKTVTALGRLQRRFLDPVSGQAGYYGIIKEGDEEAIVTVRLRSMPWSGSVLISQPILILRSDSNSLLSGPIAERPSRMALQMDAASLPSPQSPPMPVTTMRRRI